MTEIKRYEVVLSYGDAVIEQAIDGEVVMYDDHAAIVAEKDARISDLEFVLQKNAVKDGNEIYTLLQQVRALAAENVALVNSSVCTLQEGRPQYGFYASEWFIAKLKNGEYAALKALPEEYSHDYRTTDGTYYTKDWVVGWMQTPDTEYRPNVKTPATDADLREIRAQGAIDARNALVVAGDGADIYAVVTDVAASIRAGEQQ